MKNEKCGIWSHECFREALTVLKSNRRVLISLLLLTSSRISINVNGLYRVFYRSAFAPCSLSHPLAFARIHCKTVIHPSLCPSLCPSLKPLFLNQHLFYGTFTSTYSQQYSHPSSPALNLRSVSRWSPRVGYIIIFIIIIIIIIINNNNNIKKKILDTKESWWLGQQCFFIFIFLMVPPSLARSLSQPWRSSSPVFTVRHFVSSVRLRSRVFSAQVLAYGCIKSSEGFSDFMM